MRETSCNKFKSEKYLQKQTDITSTNWHLTQSFKARFQAHFHQKALFWCFLFKCDYESPISPEFEAKKIISIG